MVRQLGKADCGIQYDHCLEEPTTSYCCSKLGDLGSKMVLGITF